MTLPSQQPAEHTDPILQPDSPSLTATDVCDITTPDLIGLLYRKPMIQVVRNIWPFNGGLFVSVRARLLTDQPQLTHKSSNLKATDDNAFLV